MATYKCEGCGRDVPVGVVVGHSPTNCPQAILDKR